MLLPRSFYARPVETVARELIGRELRRGRVILRITEVEAYGGEDDSASHARFASTTRNEVMRGPPGRAYVYLCYGVHHMFNIVTGVTGTAAAVLVRACSPVAGLSEIRRRRGGLDGCALLDGPGKVGQALAIDTDWSGHVLYRPGSLELRVGEPPPRVLCGPRVGIDFASPGDRARNWRFALPDSPWVSHRRSLA